MYEYKYDTFSATFFINVGMYKSNDFISYGYSNGLWTFW